MSSSSRHCVHSASVDWSPLDVVAAWPVDRPLVVLHSGRAQARHARWTVIASPIARYRFTTHSEWIGSPPTKCEDVAFTDDPLMDLDRVLQATRPSLAAADDAEQCPFRGGWIGGLSYHLGAFIEPAAASRRDEPLRWPLIELAWCPHAMVFDHVAQTWHIVGNHPIEKLAVRDGFESMEDFFYFFGHTYIDDAEEGLKDFELITWDVGDLFTPSMGYPGGMIRLQLGGGK